MEHYLKPRPRHAILWWLVLVATIAAACLAGTELYRQYQRLVAQERVADSLRRLSHRKPAPKPTRAELETERQWTLLRQELGFSWYPIFAALEHTSNPNIALLEFRPEKATGRVTLTGTARDMEALTSYIAALAEEPIFHNVYLSHQKKEVQNNIAVISFEIRMQL